MGILRWATAWWTRAFNFVVVNQLVLQQHGSKVLRGFISQSSSPADDDRNIASARQILSYGVTVGVDRPEQLIQLSSALISRWSRTREREDLEDAISAAHEAISTLPSTDHRLPALFRISAESLLHRFELTGQATDLQEAGAVSKKALLFHPPGHPDRYLYVLLLSNVLRTRFSHLGEGEDLHDAVDRGREALSLFDPEHHDRLPLTGTLTATLLVSFAQTGASDELDQAMVFAEESLEYCSTDSSGRPSALHALSRALFIRYEQRGDIADLDAAIGHAREHIRLCAASDMQRILALSAVAAALLARYEHAGKPEDLEESIALAREALALCSPEMPSRPYLLNILVPALVERFTRDFSREEDLDASILLGTEALSLRPSRHPDHARSIISLAVAKWTRFIFKAESGDLDDGIEALRSTVALLPPRSTLRPIALGRLATSLLFRSMWLGSSAALEESVSRANDALAACGQGNRHRAMILNSLASSFGNRFVREDLNKSISFGYEALALCPPGHAGRIFILGSLAQSIMSRFMINGHTDDLNEALSLFQKTLELAPDAAESPIRMSCILALAGGLSARFHWTGNLDDISDGIKYGYEALSLCPKDHPGRLGNLATLASSLGERFIQMGQLQDSTRGIEFLHEALALCPHGSPMRGSLLTSMTAALCFRLKQTRDPEDLKACMEYGEDALLSCPLEHAARPYNVYNFAWCYQLKYAQTKDPEDLNKAIGYFRQTLAARPDQSPIHLALNNDLIDALLLRYDARGEEQDLDESVDLARNMLSSYPPEQGHPERLRVLHDLALSLCKRYDKSGDSKDILEAIRSAKESALSEPVLNRLQQLRSAMLWAQLAHSNGHPSTLDGYRACFELSERNLAIAPTLDMQHEVTRVQGSIPLDAAAFAINQGDLRLAVEMLEQGRALLWSQVRRLRTPLDELAEDAELAHLRTGFLEKSRALEAIGTSANPFSSAPTSEAGVSDPYGTMLETKRRLSAELDHVVEKIRERYPEFLRLPPYEKLRVVSAEGPVIIVNHSKYRSDALILGPGDALSCVELSSDFYERAVEMVNELAEARKTLRKNAKKYDRALRRTLQELGELLVAPVLAKLQVLGVEEGSRIWWCPTSVVSALPLHAAGPLDMLQVKSSKAKVHLQDLYVPSYTPTLAALIAARATRSQDSSESRSLLGVALLDKSLKEVSAEVDVLRAHFPEKDGLSLAMGGDCNRDVVMTGLAERPWAHFACHGTLEAGAPFNSAFILSATERLTLLDVIGIKGGLQNAELAVLSACHTAEQTQDSATEEVLHLAAAMQFSGFSSVIGTMWQMQDDDGPTFANLFYGAIFADGGALPRPNEVGFKRAARAYCSAIKEMRRSKTVNLERWVNFVHIGA
ncbi:CHAT domain-containing protein [Phanerochaete sordida]|uniref:CHAT domain-containing protein n=1 Tax=Phanerochaete sordida TaxID=48140 RepID=A0A9P3GPG7_9APHY|nr:CHAT domain-containing protein [Phanerochaete sordida]